MSPAQAGSSQACVRHIYDTRITVHTRQQTRNRRGQTCQALDTPCVTQPIPRKAPLSNYDGEGFADASASARAQGQKFKAIGARTATRRGEAAKRAGRLDSSVRRRRTLRTESGAAGPSKRGSDVRERHGKRAGTSRTATNDGKARAARRKASHTHRPSQRAEKSDGQNGQRSGRRKQRANSRWPTFADTSLGE